jgi:hypothetical protein
MLLSTIFWLYGGGVLLVEETGVPGENQQPVVSHWQIYHIMVYQVLVLFIESNLSMCRIEKH